MNAPAATCIGPVSAATVPWRARGVLYLTVVVKATCTLVPEGRMCPFESTPIASGAQPDPPGVGLLAADDRAPYLGQSEVWLVGHAAVTPHASQPSLHVQLAVVQEGVVRIDRQLDLDVAGASGNPPRVRIGGMGPIAANWPLRERWLEGIDRAGLQGPVLDLPDALHWEYFQISPLGQRLASLRGDEWLVLGGMIPGRPRLRTQLPAASAVARLYREAHTSPRAGEPIALHADTLQVDVDRRTCAILWRGRVQLADEAELASLRVVAGLEQAGQPVAWADPFPAEQVPFAGTMGLTPEQVAQIAALPAVPFAQGQPLAVPPMAIAAPSPAPEPHFTGTAALPLDFAEKLAAAMATPFEKPRMPPAELVFSETTTIPDDLARRLADAPSTPFEADRGWSAPRPALPVVARAAPEPRSPPEPHSDEGGADWIFSGTTAMPEGLSALLGSAPATPFETLNRVTAEPRPAPQEDTTPEVAAPLPAPFASVAHPAPPTAQDDASVQLQGLGAQFLAALAESQALT